MEREIELLLDKCIVEMRKGKNIEECVAQFPEYADQLKPLLELARQIETHLKRHAEQRAWRCRTAL